MKFSYRHMFFFRLFDHTRFTNPMHFLISLCFSALARKIGGVSIRSVSESTCSGLTIFSRLFPEQEHCRVFKLPFLYRQLYHFAIFPLYLGVQVFHRMFHPWLSLSLGVEPHLSSSPHFLILLFLFSNENFTNASCGKEVGLYNSQEWVYPRRESRYLGSLRLIYA